MKRHKWLLTLLLACVPVGRRRGVPALADGLFFLRWLVGGDAKLYRTLCALFPPVLFPDSTALGGDRTHSQQRDGAGWGGALWNVALIPDDLVGSGGRFRPCVLAGPCTGAAVCGAAGDQRVADKYLEVIRRKRDIFLILVFLFPFFPDDLICILAGLTDIPLHRFFLINRSHGPGAFWWPVRWAARCSQFPCGRCFCWEPPEWPSSPSA